MTAAESIAEFSKHPTLPAVIGMFVEQMQQILAKANGFRRWTRENLIRREPDAAVFNQHDQVCKWMLRLLRLIQLALAEPDFPDRSLAEEVAFTIRRLTEDWEMLHNPMPEAEARKLIPDLFAA